MYLKPGWETKILAIKPKVYLLDIKIRYLVNKMFEKIDCLSYLQYTILHTLFSFFIFIVYKANAKEEKKRRAVVNICKLNDLIVLEIYSLLLQSDIIASV